MKRLIEKYIGDSHSTIFRCYMAAVLFQFSILSFINVGVMDLAQVPFSESFWWGVVSGFGASSLLFRNQFIYWTVGVVLSDVLSVIAFLFLSFDYLTRKPPILAGGVLAATAAVFLVGGLIYERRHP